MMQQPGGVPPQGAGGMGQQGGQSQNPEEVKAMLIQAIQQMRQIAEQNGIDFESLIAENAPSSRPAPPFVPSTQ